MIPIYKSRNIRNFRDSKAYFIKVRELCFKNQKDF